MKPLVFGLAVGAAIQGWRNFPADGPVSASAGILVMLAGIVCAYLAGRWHGRGRVSASASAVASAESTAVASSNINFAIFAPGSGAATSAQRLEDAPWMGAPRAAITADDLDGFDVSDLETDFDAVQSDERN